MWVQLFAIPSAKLTALLVAEAEEMLYQAIVEKGLDLQDLIQIFAVPVKFLRVLVLCEMKVGITHLVGSWLFMEENIYSYLTKWDVKE